MPESSSFRTLFESERVHGCQTLLKPTRQLFSANFPLIQDKLSYKTSLLVRSEILGLFGNALTRDHMYCSHNLQIIFSMFQDQLHSLNILKFTHSEMCSYFNARKLLF